MTQGDGSSEDTAELEETGESLTEIQTRGCRKALFWGCLPVLLLTGSVYGVLHFQMLSTREVLAQQAERDLAELKSRSHVVPALLSPEKPGNGADFFLAAEWCISSRPGLDDPPKALVDHPVVTAFQANRALSTWRDATRLFRSDVSALSPPKALMGKLGLSVTKPRSGTAKPLTKAEAAELQRSLKLGELLREGARRTKADWGSRLERGFTTPIPNLLHLRVLARLLHEHARRSPPAEALDDGLAVLALGMSVAEADLLITAMVGVAIEIDGYRLIEEALCRPQTRETLERTLAVLAKVRRPSAAHLLECERIVSGAGLAPIAGRRLAGQPKSMEVDSISGTGLGEKLRNNPVVMTREWARYDATMRRMRQALKKPKPLRDKELQEINAELEESWSFVSRMLIINVQGADEQLVEAELARRCVQVLVAAQLHRLEAGAFPKQLKDLAGRLGGAPPLDPCTLKPLVFGGDGAWVGVGSPSSRNPAWWTTVPGSIKLPKTLISVAAGSAAPQTPEPHERPADKPDAGPGVR